jgi:beta-lactam-binding protein with PASTA domain
MRTCTSCGRENPDDRDFCECGEYLRWEPTQIVQAVQPPQPPEAPAPPEPPKDPRVEQAPPPPPPPGNGQDKVARTAVQPPSPPPSANATITLRLPESDAVHGETLGVGVEPGQRERVLAMVRNQSGIVDNYDLRVDGLPDAWWSIHPDTVYLVPYGSSGTYEQEVEVHLHPPRSPEAEARHWDLQVVARSKANGLDAAKAPLTLGILPYTECATDVRPQRAKGRRRADFKVDVGNHANAPVIVALEGLDPDGELEFGFDRPPPQIAPGQTVQTTMRVKPPKQIWIGRAMDKRFEVITHTGDDAAERLAAQPEAAQPGPSPAAKRGRFRIPGVSRPHVFKPQLRPPGVQVGPGGINLRAPQFQAPQLRGPQMPARNIELSNLKGLGGAPATPAAPLLPSQGVFRQKAWLPWWLVPVAALLAAGVAALVLLSPNKVKVPDVKNTPSAFEAEQALTAAGLKAAGDQEEKVNKEFKPGTVINQDPPAGKEVKEGSEVKLVIAVGTGKRKVPDVTGQTAVDAEGILRERGLTLGQASPQPLDPAKKIKTQIPEEGALVKVGTPVAIFFPEPGEGGKGGDKGGGGVVNGGNGGGKGGKVTIPAIAGATTAEFAQKISDAGLVPKQEPVVDEAKRDTLVATDPAAGEEVPAKTTVKLLVSAGYPGVVFDNQADVLRVDAGTKKSLGAIGKTPAVEKDPAVSPDGRRVAFVRDGQMFVAPIAKGPAVALTPEGEEFGDIAWSPDPDQDVLAFDRIASETDRDLCVGLLDGRDLTFDCKTEPEFEVGGAIHWGPGGKTLLGGGKKTDGSDEIGVVRWRSPAAFSPDIGDWSTGEFVTAAETGAKEAALSPDGKTLAEIALRRNRFELFLTEPGDFNLENARATKVRACKLAWQPDSRELVIVVTDPCGRPGPLVRLAVADPDKQVQLNADGDNPVYEPLTLGG